MARQTFQGRLRSTAGNTRSVMDVRSKYPVDVSPYNPAGPIQFHANNLGNATLELGFLPAFFAIERVAVLRPAGAGTYTLTLPAYAGLAGTDLVAATASATSTADAVLATAKYAVWGRARPIQIIGAGITGEMSIGVFGFPIDDARVSGG